MKKFFLTCVLVFGFLLSPSQDYYKAYTTEMYTFNNISKEWELYQKNSDTEITIVIENEFLSIQGKSPSMYKIYSESKEDISNKNLVGIRYKARDLKRDLQVTIDIVKISTNNTAMISVINHNDGYNFRFFVRQIQLD
jgi:hypothetical protein